MARRKRRLISDGAETRCTSKSTPINNQGVDNRLFLCEHNGEKRVADAVEAIFMIAGSPSKKRAAVCDPLSETATIKDDFKPGGQPRQAHPQTLGMVTPSSTLKIEPPVILQKPENKNFKMPFAFPTLDTGGSTSKQQPELFVTPEARKPEKNSDIKHNTDGKLTVIDESDRMELKKFPTGLVSNSSKDGKKKKVSRINFCALAHDHFLMSSCDSL